MAVEQNRDARAFGDWLRRERELRGVDLRVIADATKISKRFFEALEQGRLDVLPGGVFPRSFLRQYADHLGLDSERLVEEFETLIAEPDEPQARRFSAGRYVREHRSNLTVLAILAAVGLLGFLKVRSERNATAAFESKALATATARPAATTPPAVPRNDRVYSVATPAQSVTDGLRLAITARQTCWVAVSVDGQTVVDRILTQGESQTFEAHGEILLSVGNAGGLSFTLNDQPGIPLGRTGEVRRNIQITHQSAPSFVQDTTGALRLAQRG